MNDDESEPPNPPVESEEIRLSPGLVAWGIAALLLGLAGGLVFSLMSVVR